MYKAGTTVKAHLYQIINGERAYHNSSTTFTLPRAFSLEELTSILRDDAEALPAGVRCEYTINA